MRVWVARHGARADDDDAWAPPTPDQAWNVPLRPLGFEQAADLGRALAEATPTPTRVVVSPFQRCLQTAATALAAGWGERGRWPPVEVDRGLCEVLSLRCVGDGLDPDPAAWPWPGGSVAAAVAAALGEGVPIVGAWPRYPETLAAARARFGVTLPAAAARAGGSPLFIVTHGECVHRAAALAGAPGGVGVAHVAPTGVAAVDAGADGCGWALAAAQCRGLEWESKP